MKITGYYNESGYQIETDNPCDVILYRAGNHTLDSQQNACTDVHRLPLKTIREFCEQTAKEMAKEKNAEFIGVEYLEQGEI